MNNNVKPSHAQQQLFIFTPYTDNFIREKANAYPPIVPWRKKPKVKSAYSLQKLPQNYKTEID
jgi:hypothetical protein